MLKWLRIFGVLRLAIGLFMVAAMALHWTRWGIRPVDPAYIDFGGLRTVNVSWRLLAWLAPSIFQGVFHIAMGVGILRRRRWADRLIGPGWAAVWCSLAVESALFGTYRQVLLWLRDLSGLVLLVICDRGFVRPMLRGIRDD